MTELLDEYQPGHGMDHETMFACIQEGFPWHDPERSHPQIRTADEWWADLLPALFRGYCRAGIAKALAHDLASRVRQRYLRSDRYRLDPAAPDSLQTVAAAGWANAVLSNHVPELDRILDQLGLLDLIDTVFTSARTGYEKPNPEAFRLPFRAMGAPAGVWMVGDSPSADVLGAEATGIPAILVHGRPNAAPRSVPDLRAAARIILDSD
jgi:putative hydrolase of the HAD superfamily